MQRDWSNELILNFLELYAGESVIWDFRNKNHKMKHKVHEAWKRISSKMGNISIKELKSKKKSLMATFRPLLKKKQASIRSGVDADDVFQPTWFAYELMESFLGSIYDVDETNIEDEVQQNETVMPSPSTSSVQSLHSDEIPPSSPAQENIKKIEFYTIKGNTYQKRQNSSLGDAQKRINESFDTNYHVFRRKRVEEDECDVYGKLIAKKLRRYPERMRDRIMYKIDGLLLDNPYPEEHSSSDYSYSSQITPSSAHSKTSVHVNMPEKQNKVNTTNFTLHNYAMKTQLPQSEVNKPERNTSQEVVIPDNSTNLYEIKWEVEEMQYSSNDENS